MLLDSWIETVSTKKGLDHSKEVLCVSLGQRAAKLSAVKVGGLKKNSALGKARVLW